MQEKTNLVGQPGVAYVPGATQQMVILYPDNIIRHGVLADGVRVCLVDLLIFPTAFRCKPSQVGALMKNGPKALMNVTVIALLYLGGRKREGQRVILALMKK